MRILFIAEQYAAGGSVDALVEMIKILKNTYSIDSMVLTGHENEIGSRLEKESIEYVFCGYREFAMARPQNGFRRYYLFLLRPYFILKHLIANFKAIKIAESRIDFRQISIIHSNLNRNDFGAVLARRHKIPHIWHLRECPKGHYDLLFNRLLPIRFMNKNTDMFIAVSEFVKNEWIKLGLKEERIKVLYDGVDLGRIVFQPKQERGNKLRIACVGQITHAKGQHIIIDALNRIKNVIGTIEVDFWGQGKDKYVDFLKSQIPHEKGIIVNFKGHNPDVAKELWKYDIGINPSRNEGFGRTTVEYMAAGLCVIALDSGATPELIKDGESGFLFNDSEDLAQKIIVLQNDENTMRRASEKGRQWALTNMDMKSRMKGFADLFLSYKGDLE